MQENTFELSWLPARSPVPSAPLGSDSDKHRRQKYLVRINSSENFFLQVDSVGQRPVSTFGAVRHYAVVFIDRRAMAFAYV